MSKASFCKMAGQLSCWTSGIKWIGRLGACSQADYSVITQADCLQFAMPSCFWFILKKFLLFLARSAVFFVFVNPSGPSGA